MKELYKRTLSVLAIILLLPYILTLFISGQDVRTYSKSDSEIIVSVEVNNKITKLTETEYITGILAKEIPSEYELEAIKAQAVIIRTRLYREKEESYTESYYTYEDIIKKWNGMEATKIYEQLKVAVESTKGLVVTVSDSMVITPYHLQNSGMTRSGENGLGESYSHLQTVECSLDVTGINASSKNIIKYTDLGKALGLEVELNFSDINLLTASEDGYVTEVGIGEKVITGEQFREMYQLNSTVFSLQEGDDSYFQVTTRGSGHGIGLSQNTANYMALEGKDYIEILKYFYNGIEIKESKEIIELNEDKE